MGKILLAAMTSIAGLLCGAGSTKADLVNVRPVTPEDNGFERTLQEVLDGITPAGMGLIDAAGDQIGNAIFSNVGDEATATMIIEIAGFAKKNTFGIYSFGNPGRRATIFDGPASAGDSATIGFAANGDVTVQTGTNLMTFDGLFTPDTTPAFGFFITTPERRTFYTEDSLNPGGDAQALIYKGDDTTIVDVSGEQETFDADEFIIAFEDLVYANADRDFQDMVVFVESITPVPAPGAALLGVIGICFVGWVRRRMG